MIGGAMGLAFGAAVLGMVGGAVPMRRVWLRRGLGLGVALCLVSAAGLALRWAEVRG